MAEDVVADNMADAEKLEFDQLGRRHGIDELFDNHPGNEMDIVISVTRVLEFRCGGCELIHLHLIEVCKEMGRGQKK